MNGVNFFRVLTTAKKKKNQYLWKISENITVKVKMGKHSYCQIHFWTVVSVPGCVWCLFNWALSIVYRLNGPWKRACKHFLVGCHGTGFVKPESEDSVHLSKSTSTIIWGKLASTSLIGATPSHFRCQIKGDPCSYVTSKSKCHAADVKRNWQS